jgi:hypothetical protein
MSALNRTHRRARDSQSMKPKPQPQRRLRRRGAARVIEPAPDLPAEKPGDVYVEHPDGWYWIAPDGRQQFGPFETCSLARADRDRASEEAVDERQALREAEREVGMADWLDAETGEPAEGQSPPHLEEKD